MFLFLFCFFFLFFFFFFLCGGGGIREGLFYAFSMPWPTLFSRFLIPGQCLFTVVRPLSDRFPTFVYRVSSPSKRFVKFSGTLFLRFPYRGNVFLPFSARFIYVFRPGATLFYRFLPTIFLHFPEKAASQKKTKKTSQRVFFTKYIYIYIYIYTSVNPCISMHGAS